MCFPSIHSKIVQLHLIVIHWAPLVFSGAVVLSVWLDDKLCDVMWIIPEFGETIQRYESDNMSQIKEREKQ